MAERTSKIIGTIVKVKRLGYSEIGTPRYSLTILDADGNFETLVTRTNSGVYQDIQNLGPHLPDPRGPVALTVTAARRVVAIDPL